MITVEEFISRYSWMWAKPAPTLLPYQNYTRPKLEPVKEKGFDETDSAEIE